MLKVKKVNKNLLKTFIIFFLKKFLESKVKN